MDYKIIAQQGVIVISLSGDLTRADNPKLLECKNELLSISPLRAVILNFKNPRLIEAVVFRELTLLQHEIRKLNGIIRIVGLNSQLKTLLAEKGVVRMNEISSSLSEALKQF